MLAQDYTREQNELKSRHPEAETRLQELKDSSNITRFIENVRECTEILELTSDILNGEIGPVVFKIRTIDTDLPSRIHQIAAKEIDGSHDPGQHNKMLYGMSDYGVVPSTSGSSLAQVKFDVKPKSSIRRLQRFCRSILGWIWKSSKTQIIQLASLKNSGIVCLDPNKNRTKS